MYAMASSESFCFGAFSIFESGGITKHFASGNIEGLGETKLTVSLVANH